MLQAQLSSMTDAKGWKIETLGDDIAWCRYNENDGKLHGHVPSSTSPDTKGAPTE